MAMDFGRGRTWNHAYAFPLAIELSKAQCKQEWSLHSGFDQGKKGIQKAAAEQGTNTPQYSNNTLNDVN